MIYNKIRQKNEIINISVDKDKDIEGYVKIYNKIVNDKLGFMNGISKLFDNAIEKKEFRNLKDDVLKLIGNSCIWDIKRKGCKKDNKKKDSGVKRKGCKKDNNKEEDSDHSKNVNNDNDNDNDNLIYKLLNNKDQLHNFSDKVLNNLINVAKLREKILINNEKMREIFNKINIPKNDIRSKLDKYKKLNILTDDLINHIWKMIYGKNRANNEIDNIYCDEDEDIIRYTSKYINIVNDKLILINTVLDSINELMECLDVDTSNDIVVKKINDFKRFIIKSIDKFNSYIKLDIKKKDIEHDAKNNNKPDTKLTTSTDIKAHIKKYI